jgi:hypothetical protein
MYKPEEPQDEELLAFMGLIAISIALLSIPIITVRFIIYLIKIYG